MPNQMSPDSRRVNFIWDREAYAQLEEIAASQHTAVGEFIRRALEEKFSITPKRAILQIRQSRPAEKPDAASVPEKGRIVTKNNQPIRTDPRKKNVQPAPSSQQPNSRRNNPARGAMSKTRSHGD